MTFANNDSDHPTGIGLMDSNIDLHVPQDNNDLSTDNSGQSSLEADNTSEISSHRTDQDTFLSGRQVTEHDFPEQFAGRNNYHADVKDGTEVSAVVDSTPMLSHNAPTTRRLPFPSGGVITEHEFPAGCAFAKESMQADIMGRILSCAKEANSLMADMDKPQPFPRGEALTEYGFPQGFSAFNANHHADSVDRIGTSLEAENNHMISPDKVLAPCNYFPRGGIIAEHNWPEEFSTIIKDLEAGNMGGFGPNLEVDNSPTKSSEVDNQLSFPKGGVLTAHEFSEGFSFKTHNDPGSIDGFGTWVDADNAPTESRDNFTKPPSFPRDGRLTEHPLSPEYAQLNGMDGEGHSLEDQQPNNSYQPLIPEPISPDSAASMLFIKNPLPGREAFAGRATFPASIQAPEPSNSGAVTSHQSSASEPAASRRPGPARMSSRLHFPKDPELSLMSRGLAELSTSAHRGAFSTVTPYFDSLISCNKQSEAPETSKPQLNLLSTTSSEREKNEEQECLMALSGISVVAMNSKSTLVAMNGEQYSIANSEVWLYPCEKDRIALPHLTQLMRPSFLTNLRNLGPQKAIEAVSGHRIFNKERTSPASTKFAYRRASGTSNEGPSVMPPLSLGEPSLKLSELSDVVSSDAGSYISNPVANISSGVNIGTGGIVMDGSVERPSGPTLSPMPFTGSPAAITRAGSEEGEEGSVLSVKTNKTSGSEVDSEWDHEALLKLTNSVRLEIKTSKISQDNFEALKGLLDRFLADELSPQAAENVGLTLITQARLDKLLEDLIQMRRVDAEFDGLVTQASTLQRMWQQRLGTDYYSIDEERFDAMIISGSLRGLTLGMDSQTRKPKWQAQRSSPLADSELSLGQWWPNMHCVYRDGIVDSTNEKLTTGKYGTPVFPLLTGEEVDGPSIGMYTYTFRGTRMGTHFDLIQKYGSKIKVLRSHRMKSRYAPKAGIRYDGEYKVDSWVHLPHDPGTEIRTFKIKLVRVSGQVSVNVLRNIPTPAHMDEWKLYQNYMKQAMMEAIGGPSTNPIAYLVRPSHIAAYDGDLPRLKDVADREWGFDEVFG